MKIDGGSGWQVGGSIRATSPRLDGTRPPRSPTHGTDVASSPTLISEPKTTRRGSCRPVEPRVADPVTAGRMSKGLPRPRRALRPEGPGERYQGRDGEGHGPGDDADHRREE